jgi:glucosamine--fructose-6-phosphate aminotransferase (isomerizing)
VAFSPRLAPDVARGVLQGYRGRYAALKDAVTETEPAFDDSRLADVDLVDLLTEPVYVLAEQWRTR